VTNQRIEAREIRAEAAARHPDRDPPAVKTMSVTYGNRMSKIDQLFVVGGGFLAVRRIADDQ
jgi:hypothetical protein